MSETVATIQNAIDRISHPVTEEQALTFFDALEAGATVAEASQTAGFNRRTGHRLLERYEVKLDAVQKLLAAKAMIAAEAWIESTIVASRKGDHRPAKDLLQTIKAVDPIDGGNTGSGVTIIIGTPEAPIRIGRNPDTFAHENAGVIRKP